MKFLFALLGVALAAHSSLPLARPLPSEKEFRFRYEASLVSGIPLPTTDSALTRIRADVIVQIPNERTALFRLHNVEMDKDVQTSEFQPMENLEKRVISEEYQNLLKMPVRFSYKNGIVSELQFAFEEQTWSANLKRAVINMLQLNLKDTPEQENWENSHYTIVEKTIEGECEVSYTIVSEEEKTLVSKSVNFEKCERRSDVAYNQRFVSECPECDYKMIVPQTVYNYKIEKEQLKEVEVRSVYSVSLKDQPLMKTETRARLTLVEKSEIKRQMEAPKGQKEELIFSSELERSMEEFYKVGDEVEQKPFEQITNKVEMIKDMVANMAEIKENTPETVHLFARLVRVLRMCSQEDLRKVHEKVEKKCELKEKTIIEHALAVAGTKNTVEHLIRHIENITPIKAAQLLKSIQETPYPSELIADLLFKLSETELCRREPVIRQSVWLAYGAVVRGVVAPTQEKVLVEAPKHLKEKFVNILKKQYKNAETVYEKILALKTFANAGIDTSIVELEKIIYDKEQPTAVRMEAIEACRLLTQQMPRKIQKVMMPIYTNRMEKNELRMSALSQLMQSKPQQPELFQIVQRMEREPNQHVAAFTYHMLTSLSKSPLPSHRNVSATLTPMLRQSLFRPEQRIFSIYQHLPLFHEESISGLNVNFGAIFGKDSVIPKDIMASLETVFGGNWNKYLAQIGFSHQNVEQLFSKVLSKLSLLQKEQKNTLRASRISSSVSLLKELARKLNIRVRDTVTMEPHAMLYLRYKQMDYAVLPINEQIVDEMIEKYLRHGSIDMKQIERLFNKDSDFEFAHAGFFFETVNKMPTTLGLPLTISSKLPTVFSANGLFSLEKIGFGIRARLQMKPTLASTHLHFMNVWIPSVFEHGVKIVRTLQAATPIDVELEVTLKNKLEVVFRHQMPEQELPLFRLESRPVAFVRFIKKSSERYPEAEEKTISLPKAEKMMKEINYKTELAGLETVVSGTTFRLWTLENVLLGEHHLELVVRPTSRIPKQVEYRLISENVMTGRMEEPKIEKLLQKEMSVGEGQWERRSDSSRREYLRKMIREMDLTSGFKHRLFLSINANKKTEIELRTECEGKLSFCRLSTEIRLPSEERRDWKLNSLVEVVVPRFVSSIEELKEQNHREIQMYTQTKWGSEERNEIEITLQLEQSKEQRNLVKEPKMLRGLPAYELLSRLARLNQLKAVAKYELSPKTEKMFERFFDLVKVYTWWNSNLELTENDARRVVVLFTVDPIVPRMSKLNIQTPKETLLIQNIRMPLYLVPSIIRMPKNVLRHSVIEKSECSIDNGRVNTFDNDVFRAPLSTCYTVLAKDCTEEPRYAVLMKNIRKNSEEKALKVIYEDNVYELHMTEDKMKIMLNGKTISEGELEDNKIEKIGQQLYVIDLDEIVVRFDGYTAKVLLGNTEMNTQCGLCGHFDGEKKNEYRTASNEETEDIEEFHRSYIVKTEECSAETFEKKQYKEYSKESSSEEDEYYSQNEYKKEMKRKNTFESSEYDEEKKTDSEEPKKNILVQEFDHRLCFSLERTAECPKPLINGKPVEKKVRFGCLPRHDSAARRLLEAIRRNDIVKTEQYVSDLKLSFVDNIHVPTFCVAA